MGNDHNHKTDTPPPTPVVEAQPEYDDAFQVLADLGRDFAAGAARVAETLPNQKVQDAAAKAVLLGQVTAHAAGKAREVAQEVAHFGRRSAEAVERLEDRGVPVKRWWQTFVDVAQITTDPLPTNQGPDVCVGPAPRPEPVRPKVKVTMSPAPSGARIPHPQSSPNSVPGVPRGTSGTSGAAGGTGHSVPLPPDESGVVSPSDPRTPK